MKPALLLGASATLASAALDVDLTSTDSIKAAARTVTHNLMTYYKGNLSGQTPGILPGPPPAGDYYWWEGGALWGTLVDYWYYTGDSTYNDQVQDCLVFQAGAPQNSYMPPNWTASLGNDDQGFWGLSALLAAETNFQNPPADDPQWLALAQAVFNTQAERWDTQYCNGGLRWQIPFSNNGYNYKNSISNGILFNLGARLARYTGNNTYSDWATKVWDWTVNVGYINSDYSIYDGAHVEENCTDINKAQFSYTAAAYIQGAGFMYNYTNASETWSERLQGLTKQTINVFFPDGVAVERACELDDRVQCTTDMLSFKGYLHRWLAQTTQMAPVIRDTVYDALTTSAQGAVNGCNADGTCGFRWNTGSYDGDTGAGQQMNVLGALISMLAKLESVAGPVTNSTGGTSTGNSNAGSDPEVVSNLHTIKTSDRAGAGILTAIVLIGMVSMSLWMTSGLNEGGGMWTDGIGEKAPNRFST
ncbi:putative glycoside hydrolase family 76 protein [Phaeoacremonium minimum UCRPA7]|uniref:Mannan endo-1,6-alpha-mannosidase n=1 Tax=Phaeoacremonium minimum (strain UCR-PA7) TaxID=1286976 RepID=R8BLQ6_PHAM7|nr:putative glycoside hydrolase family 76 protein [Phaeoacremonium minimum UCRPA7]EOO00215.1 putative glycoside hydrolase family 76 protein [Phaeoacremonium minimum UCRPA7]